MTADDPELSEHQLLFDEIDGILTASWSRHDQARATLRSAAALAVSVTTGAAAATIAATWWLPAGAAIAVSTTAVAVRVGGRALDAAPAACEYVAGLLETAGWRRRRR